MAGPPLQLMVNPNAQHIACHTPTPVPIQAGLDQDVWLGVIEPVLVGTPVTCCHKMVICPKKMGKPRRTVDLQPLNRLAATVTSQQKLITPSHPSTKPELSLQIHKVPILNNTLWMHFKLCWDWSNALLSNFTKTNEWKMTSAKPFFSYPCRLSINMFLQNISPIRLFVTMVTMLWLMECFFE